MIIPETTNYVNPNVRYFPGLHATSTPSAPAQMLSAALTYGEAGLYVVPLHEPLFDNAGACVGCTCEAHKRSANYQAWLTERGRGAQFTPDYVCRTPGKHPRLSDWEVESSKDADKIRQWFTRWPTANIGLAVGKSGLVMLDADCYKENYAGANLLSRSDEFTVTAISGNGGQHYYYQKPDGKEYTNANNTLPDGIDIRCNGGMVVVAPSIHPSGNPYQWEDGYSILESSPRPLPQALETLLDDAQTKHAPAKAVIFTTPTTARPDLTQWHLSKRTRWLIENPAPAGQRSESDMKVIVSLCYAGATDDQILGVYQNYPIGTSGKFAESGERYLALTIGNARAFVESHPRIDVAATVEPLRLAIRTTSFEPFVSDEFKTFYTNRKTGETTLVYRNDATDTKTADAVLDAMQEDGRLEIAIGRRRLGKLAGVGEKTALRALSRLNGWLFDVTVTKQGARVALTANCRLHYLAHPYTLSTVPIGGPSSANDNSAPVLNEYSPRKADDEFMSGTSRKVRDDLRKASAAADTSYQEAKEQYSFASPAESGLRIIDALKRVGADLTAEELAAETGKKLSAIRVACRRLVSLGLLEEYRPGSRGAKQYTLPSDVWERLEAVAPHLRSFTLGAQREDDRLVTAIQYTQRELAKAQEVEEQRRLDHRIKELSAQRIPHLARLHDDLSAEQIELFASDIALPAGLHPAKQAKLDSLRSTARMDVAEMRRAPEWEAAKFAATKTARLATATVAPIAPVTVPLFHRWQFVGQNELLLTELERSLLSEDGEKRTAAQTLKKFLDGDHSNFGSAKSAAYQLGLSACRGILWGALQTEAVST